MSSQFDSLLDFGDDPHPSTNGTAETANGNNDDFDPFGPSPSDKGGAGDSGMLLDFSVATEVSGKTENGTSDPFDTQFTVTSSTTDDSSSNPFMDISSADTQSSSANPFADMSTTDTSTSQSANPLYDLMDDDFAAPVHAELQSANPLYDLSGNDDNANFTQETTTTTDAPSANPLYDFTDQEEMQMMDESKEVDFDTGSGMEKSTPSEDILVQANNGFAEEDQVVPEVTQQQESGPREVIEEEEEETTQEREATQQEEEEETGGQESFDQNVELYIREDVEEQTAVGEAEEASAPVEVDVDVADNDDNDSTKGHRRSRSKSPSRSRSISSEREVLNEEEELRQDGRTVYKTREEQSFTESGFGDSGQMREDYGVATSGGVENGTQREDFHFSEMSSVKNQFERGPQEPQRKPVNIRDEVAHSEGGVYESQPATFQPQHDDETEEGIYENQPQLRADVARESDRNIGAELPSVGTAKSMRDRFATGQVERASGSLKKESSPSDAVDGGVFENQPQYNPDVVHSGEHLEDKLPEQGHARNIAGRFKELEKQGSSGAPTPGRREITPDRSGKVEYVSEPRGQLERYEGQSEAGVFESQPQERADVVKSGEYSEEILPERGTAKNVAQRFKQMSTGTPSPAPRGKRELTPDTSGRVEYVSEPRGHVEMYEGQAESGVFESQPANRDDVVKSDQLPEEIMPERGAAKNIAAKFREMEKTTKSPPSPSKYKEFTPPRENGSVSGVYESNPTRSPDVVTSEAQAEEILPERGTAKNLANRFRQLSSSDNSSAKSPRAKKEFTPPPQEGVVFENNPQQFIPDYNRPAESGILESQPEFRSDVVRGDEPPKYEEELPERGFTRNLVSAWKQRETESTKISPTSSGKPKEFTPPREEPRVAQQRPAPRTPKSPGPGADLTDGSVHPMDLPGQYQPQVEPSVFESEPEHLEGVVKEDDTDWMAGMPKADTTKKMLAKFRNIQAEASKEQPRPQPSGRKGGDDSNSSEAASDQVVRSKSMRVAVQLEKCGACQKTVYAMEKIEIEKNAYHKSCFRCSHCHCVLTPKTFAVNNRVMFCTNHYKQLFAAKGNYDEGFGRDQHKKRWKSESNLADGQTEDDSSSSEQHH